MNKQEKPLFIFEMANNHQGSVEHGIRIINEIHKVCEAYKAQFNFAFKFQYRNLDTFIHPEYIGRTDIKNVKRFQDTKLTEVQFEDLLNEVERLGFYTMCTPFDEKSVERIEKQNYQIIKIASCSFNDWPLLERIAKAHKPVIASTAGTTFEDIKKVVNFFEHRNIELSLMHCVAEYPTPLEHLQLNQVDLLKKAFPNLKVGFSTHESPDCMEAIKVAVSKGAMLFEKHVGVETETIHLNAYSATPAQVEKWLEAALQTYKICGLIGKRYVFTEKEATDLQALKRGVFAKEDLAAGEKITEDKVYYAFPCTANQLLVSNLSKYSEYKTEVPVKKNGAIMLPELQCKNNQVFVENQVAEVIKILKKSNVVVPINSICEISHHYGMEHFKETGVTIINCINREYCKKILVMLPGQKHPVHMHKLKEETFNILYGDLECTIDGKVQKLLPGESAVVERGAEHSFSSEKGAVFEEISTTHYKDDSYYEASDTFVPVRKTIVYITKEMLK